MYTYMTKPADPTDLPDSFHDVMNNNNMPLLVDFSTYFYMLSANEAVSDSNVMLSKLFSRSSDKTKVYLKTWSNIFTHTWFFHYNSNKFIC